MPRWLTDIRRRPVRSLGPVALLALAPKCLLCLLAYAGLGAAMGRSSPEFCGAAASSSGGWAPALAWFGGSLGIAVLLNRRS